MYRYVYIIKNIMYYKMQINESTHSNQWIITITITLRNTNLVSDSHLS